jgi:hypothetical protein
MREITTPAEVRDFASFLHTFFKRALEQHESPDGEFLPHVYVGGLVQDIGDAFEVEPAIQSAFFQLLDAMSRSTNPEVIDLLYASMFPQMLQYPHLVEQLKDTAPRGLVQFFTDWMEL